VSYLDTLRLQLQFDEGVRSKPYADTAGKITIGVGRNLDDVGVGRDEIDLMLSNDIDRAEGIARRLIAAFDDLSDARKAVVCNLAFNLGNRLAKFSDTLDAINDGRFEDAADAMLDSLWAKEVGARATRLALAMREG
jgi:lysozyme